MSLTRADLENGLMFRLWRESGQSQRVLSEAESDANAATMLAAFPGTGDPWIFAYGSLVWNPLLDYAERNLATLHGFHRRFCLWSKTGRGSPDKPGLVLGLDRGGCCRGIAYRIERAKAAEEFRLLWRREMIAGAYAAKWLPVKVGDLEAYALAFVIRREHPNYAGKLPCDQLVETLATACGRIGSSRDYLCQTVEGLRQHGIVDPLLEDLRTKVNAVAALAFPTAGDE